MLPEEQDSLIHSWLTIQRHWWAYESLENLCRENPEGAWPTVLALVAAADTDELLSAVAAGPLEDLLDAHPSEFIEILEALAPEDQKLRQALANIWLSEHEEALLQRYIALGCQFVAARK